VPEPTRKKNKKAVRSGKLRIADHWNAISIIANSQANPLKALSEFVENSIDARAKQIVIVRGKKGERSISRLTMMARASQEMKRVCRIFVAWQPISVILSRDSSNQREPKGFRENSVLVSLVSGRLARTSA
jgi:hypothetical protein